MKVLIRLISLVIDWVFSAEDQDDNADRNSSGVIKHLRVPNDALGIVESYGIYYETSSRIVLPTSTPAILKELSCSREWHQQGRFYFTSHDWVTVFCSKEPIVLFKQRVKEIEETLRAQHLII